MKKLTCLILTIICVLSFAMFLTACDSKEDTKAGLKVRNIDGVYTVVGYAEEKVDGKVVDTLSISTYKTSDGVEHQIGAIKTGAFKGNTNLKNIVVGDSVTEIGAGAFANMTKLESLQLPFVGRKIVAYDSERLFGYVFGTTEYTGGYAVTQNYNDSDSVTTYFPQSLQNVKIANTLSAYSEEETPITSYTLPKYAFNGVISLTSVTFDVNIEAIGDSAFANCSGIKSFALPKTVKTIGEKAFYQCLNLNGNMNIAGTENADFTYTADSKLTEIKDSAFLGTKLLEVVLPNSVEKIGDFAFASEETEGAVTETGASKITSIAMQDNVTEIGKYAFYKCDKLATVTIGNKIKKIGEGAFSKCTALNEVKTTGTFENDVYIYAWAFYGCKNLSKFFADGVNNTVILQAIKSIGADAFNGCAKLETPEFESLTIELGDRAFANCSSINSVNTSAFANYENVFKGCPLGINFALNSNVYDVASYSSAYQKMTEVIIPDEYCGVKVVSISSEVFEDSTNITSIVVGSNVATIEGNAFSGCTNLSKVSFGANITNIGENILKDTNYANNDANYSGNILYVSTYAVGYKGDVTNVVIKDGTTLIAESMLKNNTQIDTITIASTVKYIGVDAFSGCTLLKDVYIDSEDVAKACTESTSCGSLLENAKNVFVKSNIYAGNIGKFITDFGTPVKEGGYYKYSK